MSSIIKWKIFCNTETDYVTGFLSSDKEPTTCFNNNTHVIDTTKTKFIEKIYNDNTEQLNKWEMFCDTENTYVTGYTVKDEYPEKCFNNIDHVISRKPQLIEKIKNNTVRIKEESIQTGGNFKAICPRMICPVGTSTHDYTFEHPISAMSITLNTVAANTNHEVNAFVGPDTVIGTITGDVNVSDTVINVSSTVTSNVNIGYMISLYDGVQTENLGIVKSIDLANNTITISTPSTKSFLASTPTYVRLTVSIIEDFTIGNPGRYELGKDKIGGSYVPTGTIIRVVYNNTGSETVDFYAVIEYLY